MQYLGIGKYNIFRPHRAAHVSAGEKMVYLFYKTPHRFFVLARIPFFTTFVGLNHVFLPSPEAVSASTQIRLRLCLLERTSVYSN